MSPDLNDGRGVGMQTVDRSTVSLVWMVAEPKNRWLAVADTLRLALRTAGVEELDDRIPLQKLTLSWKKSRFSALLEGDEPPPCWWEIIRGLGLQERMQTLRLIAKIASGIQRAGIADLATVGTVKHLTLKQEDRLCCIRGISKGMVRFLQLISKQPVSNSGDPVSSL
jgi:hypothetical protein